MLKLIFRLLYPGLKMTAILNSRWRTTNRKAEYATYCSLYLHNLMAYCVEVDVHTGHDPPPWVWINNYMYVITTKHSINPKNLNLLFVSATFQGKRLSNVCDAKLLRNFCNFILVTVAMRCLSSEGILKIGTLNSKTILKRTQISYLTWINFLLIMHIFCL